MNRRRVSSPPPARARSSRPLSPSHRARRPRDRIDDRGTESTIARANHTECDDFHARCVDRVTQNVRIARNVRSFTSSRVRRVRRGRRGLPRASSCTSFISFHSRAACIRRAAARVGVTDTHTLRVTTHHTTFRVFFLPKRAKKKSKNRKAHATRRGGVHTSHDPIERERIARAGRAKMPSRSIARERDTQKHARGWGLDDGS